LENISTSLKTLVINSAGSKSIDSTAWIQDRRGRPSGIFAGGFVPDDKLADTLLDAAEMLRQPKISIDIYER